MLTAAAYIKILVVVNPFGIIPVFVATAVQQSVIGRQRIARIAGLAVAVVLITSAVLGERIFDLFGISIASFKVGGAILVMLTAISMMQAMPSRDKQTPEEAKEAEDKDQYCRGAARRSPAGGSRGDSHDDHLRQREQVGIARRGYRRLRPRGGRYQLDCLARRDPGWALHEPHLYQRGHAPHGTVAGGAGCGDFCRRRA
jgi:hypothetical protein